MAIDTKQAGNAPKQLSSRETSMICEQIAMVLQAGIPLHDSMETLCETYKNTPYYDRFVLLDQQMRERGTLYEAIASAGFFPSYMTQMVKIGERSGKLDIVMSELAEYYARDDRMSSAIRSAVRYPLVLVGMMTVVIAVLIAGVLPIFTQIFRNLGLGASSNWMMSLSLVVGRAALVVVGLLLIGVLCVTVLLRTKHRKKIVETFQKIFPPLRKVQRKLSAGRFASVMGMMLASGFPLDEAIDMAPSVLPDDEIREGISRCKTRIQEGVSFAEALEEMQMFDTLSHKMIHAGSLAGQMDEVMHRIALRYDEETDDALRSLIGGIEPALVALLTTVVGAILLSIMLPLASIISTMT